jgi:hypothetical protein
MRLLSSLLFVFFIWVLPVQAGEKAGTHDFYAGIIDIHHNQDNQSLEIAVKLFIDDVDAVLEQFRGYEFKLATPDQREGAEDALASYFQDHFKLNIDGERYGWNWLGYEFEEEVIWVYLECENLPQKPAEFGLRCSLLTDRFERQVNYIHFVSGDFNRRWAFNVDYYEDLLRFPE